MGHFGLKFNIFELAICSLDFSDIVPNDIDTVEDGTACALL